MSIELLSSAGAYNAYPLLPGLHVVLHEMQTNSFVISLLPTVGLGVVLLLSLIAKRQALEKTTFDATSVLFIACLFTITAVFMSLHTYDYTLLFLMFTSLFIVKWYTVLILLPGILLTTVLSIKLKVFEVIITTALMKSIGIIYLTICLVTIVMWCLFSQRARGEAQ